MSDQCCPYGHNSWSDPVTGYTKDEVIYYFKICRLCDELETIKATKKEYLQGLKKTVPTKIRLSFEGKHVFRSEENKTLLERDFKLAYDKMQSGIESVNEKILGKFPEIISKKYKTIVPSGNHEDYIIIDVENGDQKFLDRLYLHNWNLM